MSNTSTDPAGFDPEATGAFKVPVKSLSELDQPTAMLPPVPPQQPEYLRVNGPALMYHHSDGRGAVTRIDLSTPLSDYSDDTRLRELMIARALLRHALHLVDKELNGL